MSRIAATRQIGSDVVTGIGLGLMGISTWYGAVAGDEDRLKFLNDVFARGERNWDTADCYADSEELIGKWKARSSLPVLYHSHAPHRLTKTGNRASLFLATKFGFSADPLDTASGRIINADPAYVRAAIGRSLDRLQTDYIDLYYLHRADPTVPIEHTVQAMAELVREGKVKYLGLSEVSAATLRRAHAVHPISALQVEYSAFDLTIEDAKIDLLKTARELGIKIVAYSPLGRGILTGRYTSPDDFEESDIRRILPKYSKENFPNVLKLVDGFRDIAARYGATPGQIALAWLLAQGDDIIPIPGTSKVKYLDENLGALTLRLTPADIAEVRHLAEGLEIEGARVPEGYEGITFADTPAPAAS